MSQIDVLQLIEKFKEQGPDLSFKTFKSAWASLQFSHIHLARVEGETMNSFMNDLYAAIFAVMVDGDQVTQLGCLFALYATYLTCKGPQRVTIMTPLYCWNMLRDLRAWLITNRLADAIQILHFLRTEKCICICADVMVGDEYLLATGATSTEQSEHIRSRIVAAKQLANEVQKEDVMKDVADLPLMRCFSTLFAASRSLITDDHGQNIVDELWQTVSQSQLRSQSSLSQSQQANQSVHSSSLAFVSQLDMLLTDTLALRAIIPTTEDKCKRTRKRYPLANHLYDTQAKPTPPPSELTEAGSTTEQPQARGRKRGRPPDKLHMPSNASTTFTSVPNTTSQNEPPEPIKIVLTPSVVEKPPAPATPGRRSSRKKKSTNTSSTTSASVAPSSSDTPSAETHSTDTPSADSTEPPSTETLHSQ